MRSHILRCLAIHWDAKPYTEMLGRALRCFQYIGMPSYTLRCLAIHWDACLEMPAVHWGACHTLGCLPCIEMLAIHWDAKPIHWEVCHTLRCVPYMAKDLTEKIRNRVFSWELSTKPITHTEVWSQSCHSEESYEPLCSWLFANKINTASHEGTTSRAHSINPLPITNLGCRDKVWCPLRLPVPLTWRRRKHSSSLSPWKPMRCERREYLEAILSKQFASRHTPLLHSTCDNNYLELRVQQLFFLV